MKLSRKTNTKEFELCPAGTHNAVCYRVVDLGTHKREGQYALDSRGNQRYQHKLSLYWEVDEPMSDGRRFMVFETMTASLSDNADLYKLVKSWKGEPEEGFDPLTLAGEPCLLTVAHNPSKDGTRTYVNVVSAVGLPKGFAPLKPENEVFSFDLSAVPFDRATFEKLSDWTQDTIKKSKEYKAAFPGPGSNSDMDDDIPPF